MRKLGLALLALLVGCLALTAGAGMAAASHDATNATEYHNQTITVDNDTQSVYVDVQNTNGTTVHAYIYGIDSDGTETEVTNGTLTAAEGETDSLEQTADSSTYDSYRIVVEGDDTTDQPTEIVSGVISKLEGGGGVSIGSSLFGLPVWMWLIVALGAGAVVLGGDKANGRRN